MPLKTIGIATSFARRSSKVQVEKKIGVVNVGAAGLMRVSVGKVKLRKVGLI